MHIITRIVISLILFWVFGSLTFSQHCSFKRFNWITIEKNIDDSIKLTYLKKANIKDNENIKDVLDTSRFYIKDSAITYYKREFAKFHLLDFNGDNLIDLIYDQQIGEVPIIIFFINTGDSLKCVFNTIGYAETVTIKNDKILAMQTVIPPCCCPFSYNRDYYSFRTLPCKKGLNKKNSDPGNSPITSNLFKYRRIATEALGYYVLPKNDNLNEEFVSPQGFYLTIDPKSVLNKTIPDHVDCTYSMTFNNYNQIAEFNANTKGIILSNYTSKDGIMYSFIKIKNKISKQSVFGKNDFYIYGWTLTKNIKKTVANILYDGH